MHKLTTRDLTLAAVVAAAYAALTLALPGPSYGYAQLRVSEALCVLPFFFPATAPGLLVGCLVANLISPYGLVDVVCGTFATGLAAFLTSKMPHKWLAPLPPVLCNGVIVGGMLAWYEAGFGPNFWSMFALAGPGVALGEVLACYVLGGLLIAALPNIPPLRRLMVPERLV
ncbi:MAG: QueT transporter family protein [Oscillospiraceae bacterium]|nr:QueT transporter family protein [Oscillospiraceae bacterium]